MSICVAPPYLSVDESILTKDKFHLIIGKHSCDANISIHRDKITYQTVNGAQLKGDSIAFSDIVGCRRIGGAVDQQSLKECSGDGTTRKQKTRSTRYELKYKSICLQIFVYMYNKNPKNGGVRRRKELTLIAEEFEMQEENAALVEKWYLTISALLRGVEFASMNDLKESLIPKPPHYLVCINPFSGKGKSHELFKNEAKPILEEAGITFKEIITERKGHGHELAVNLDLNQYNGVIIVSGDGLVYEFINGFGERPDREEAFKMPIGIIPGGSGNALCSAILSTRGDSVMKNIVCHAAVAIVKGQAYPKDLVRIETSHQTVLSFLSVAWGLIADIDIESERFRFLGGTRFAVGTVQRILFLRKYPGRLSFLPIKDESKYRHLWQVEDKKLTSAQDVNVNKCQQREQEDVKVQPEVGGNRNSNHNVNASLSNEGAAAAVLDDMSEPVMPSLDEQVPSYWTVIQGDFVCVLISYVSHISNDFINHPGRAMDEGVIMLQYMDVRTNRKKLIGTLDKFKTGEFMKEEFVVSRVVKAFRLEPLTKDGILTVDGERVKFSPIQGTLTTFKCHCIM
ncbi:sphingosine kinase 2-like [Lytechinus pictus]|uniref:sphingosine kinase 2-like n=1 Tax=Lytechinus pictus TaxID=7653 RepID=UPI0030BA0691